MRAAHETAAQRVSAEAYQQRVINKVGINGTQNPAKQAGLDKMVTQKPQKLRQSLNHQSLARMLMAIGDVILNN